MTSTLCTNYFHREMVISLVLKLLDRTVGDHFEIFFRDQRIIKLTISVNNYTEAFCELNLSGV